MVLLGISAFCVSLDPAHGSNEVLDSQKPFTCGAVPYPGAPRKSALLSAPAAPNIPGIGEKRLLLYRVDFSDAVDAAISSNNAATLLTDLNSYYREMSYNLMTIAPSGAGSVITDTLRLPEPSTGYDNNFTKLINDTRQAAANAGYAPESFDSDVVFTGAKPFLVFGALSYVGGPGIWIGNGNFNVGVLGHELGHNLGLPHASFWSTGDQSSIGPGTKEEYGDPFDSMGVPGGNTSHFNAYFKHFVGWISDADAPTVTSNGIYRIVAHDNMASSGVRALRIPRTTSQDYWLEFRNNFNSRFVTNGLGVRWGGREITNSFLIDTTPGTQPLKQDSPIRLGKTFSDHCLDLHITPIGKAGTIPEAIDVVVNRGPFPGNVPPTVTVTASSTNPAVASAITLQAIASDANNDGLAYWWDMGDGNFGSNQPTIQYAWAAAGEYVARCTVSDMKGGTASSSVLIRVGTVTTFLAEGHVRYPDGTPVEGAVIKSGARFTYSDTDGRYRLSRLSAGRQTLSGVLDGYNLMNSGFDNPLTVGPNASGCDFVALPFDLNSVTLVATGSTWQYLDTGAAPANNWTGASFDDTAWKTGRAKLGYGLGDEATIVGWGPNGLDRYVTTWFRQRFVVNDIARIDYLVARLRRDDGVVVYVNGQELYRENMPGGAVSTTTTALSDVLSTEEATFFRRFLPPSTLHAGTNVIAVEAHQVRTNSTDLSFDFELSGLSSDLNALRPSLRIDYSPAAPALLWPSSFIGWSVWQLTALSSSAPWTLVPNSPAASNGWNRIPIVTINESGFFQLRKPTFCSPLP